MKSKAPCPRCSADVRDTTAVAFVFEAIEHGRVIERRMLYGMHPSCAGVRGAAVLRWAAHRYRKHEHVEFRYATRRLEPGAAWLPPNPT